MENLRELFQVMTRRFGMLNKRCCTTSEQEAISLVQSHILHEIVTRPDSSIQQLAEVLGQDITTFSRQVNSLVDLGMVKKTPYPSDRRIQILSLTDKGKRVAEEIDREVNLYLEEIFSQMTDFEKEIVIRSLQKLTRSMGESTMCCTPLR